MLSAAVRYAFIDESGTETPFSGSHFLVVALVSVANVRDLALAVRRTYKKFGSGVQTGELKAATSLPEVRRHLLKAIAEAQVEIMAVVVDKRTISRPPTDPADIYRLCVARSARFAAAKWPSIEVCLDRRYSVARLRDRLDQAIQEAIADLPEAQVMVHQEDSITQKGLQAADFVSWALFQKYERGDLNYYRIVQPKIVVEELIAQELW